MPNAVDDAEFPEVHATFPRRSCGRNSTPGSVILVRIDDTSASLIDGVCRVSCGGGGGDMCVCFGEGKEVGDGGRAEGDDGAGPVLLHTAAHFVYFHNIGRTPRATRTLAPLPAASQASTPHSRLTAPFTHYTHTTPLPEQASTLLPPSCSPLHPTYSSPIPAQSINIVPFALFPFPTKPLPLHHPSHTWKCSNLFLENHIF